MALTLDDIKNFIVVSETLNVTRASQLIGITQPTLSYSIKRLELELGNELIIRLKSGVQLSKFGEIFLSKAKKLQFEWEALSNISKEGDSDFRGKYIFAIHPSVALASVEQFLPHITSLYKGLNIEFLHGLSREMTEKVINWEADFGVVVNPIQHPDLVIKKIKKDVVTLFATKNSKNKLIYNPRLSQSQSLLKKMKKYQFDAEIHSDSLEVVSKLASIGEGYALLPTSIAKQFKGLNPVSDAPIYNDEICLIYRPERHRNDISREIIKSFY